MEPGDVAADFESLHQYLGAGATRRTALARLVELVVRTVPGCDWASVTAWPSGEGPRSLACSDPIALGVDELQQALAEGPCLDASAPDEPACIPDVGRETRWPRFCEATYHQTPVRGVLSFDVAYPPHRTALNLYSSRAAVFGTDTLSLGALFAAHARVLLQNADHPDDSTNLKQALGTSRQVGMAIGILMSTHQVSEDTAFGMLRRTSQTLNLKLPDVAADVARTGELPG